MYLVIVAGSRSRVQDARGGRIERDDMAERLGSAEGLGMGNLCFVACSNRCLLITWRYVYRSMIKVAVQQILVSLLDLGKNNVNGISLTCPKRQSQIARKKTPLAHLSLSHLQCLYMQHAQSIGTYHEIMP